ncbi:MAG: flagellar biosynthetic protein FliR [Alphaproteobacteria bacterium]|nr:flagellar biosynthetic protein FliR [Alphaproteobacteria bacterium]
MTLYGVDLWAGALIFARIGAMAMLLPGFGEPAVSPRFRLGLAIMITAVLAPSLAGQIPAAPDNAWAAAGRVSIELFIGGILGGAARLLMSALATAGQIMGLESGLAFAQTADPTMTQTGQIFGVFLGLLGVTLIFAFDLHHLFIAAMANSYAVFRPGEMPDLGDASEYALETVATSFRIGVQIAAPMILGGLIFRVGLGVLARLIPSIQVFFVALPLQVMGAFMLMALGISAGMLVWLDSVERFAEGIG